MKTPLVILSVSLFWCQYSVAQQAPRDPNYLLDETPWSLMLYRGWTSTKNLNESLRFQYESAHEDMYAAELAYTLAPTNPISQFLWYIRSRFQLAGNVAYRRDKEANNDILELDLYFMLRWRNFPWNRFLATTFAIGEGISWASQVPSVEKIDDDNDSRKLLNYLMFEATFALPSHPDLQLVYRLNHRSGAYGLFDNSDFGSNVLGFGLRYHF